MDPRLQESILQVFTETQQWTQQFIVEDSGKLVDLASATIQQASTTPENAQNQPPSYPHRSVYRFDSTKYKGKESFQMLVLMIQNALHGAPFSFVRGSKNNRFVLCCSHHRLQETKQTSNTHVFKQGNYTQEGVKTESVKRQNCKSVASIDAMAGKQESKAMKCTQTSRITQYSDNQPIRRRVVSIRKADKKDRCNCRIGFFLWPDGFFYLDHTTTNLTHTGHPEYTSGAKLKGIRFISDQSKLLIERMSAVGVRPSQLTILLEMLDESDGSFQSTTVKNLIQKCELLQQKELGIDHTMSSAEKAMEFLSRYLM